MIVVFACLTTVGYANDLILVFETNELMDGVLLALGT